MSKKYKYILLKVKGMLSQKFREISNIKDVLF